MNECNDQVKRNFVNKHRPLSSPFTRFFNVHLSLHCLTSEIQKSAGKKSKYNK